MKWKFLAMEDAPIADKVNDIEINLFILREMRRKMTLYVKPRWCTNYWPNNCSNISYEKSSITKTNNDSGTYIVEGYLEFI